jgi:hypothetical protein
MPNDNNCSKDKISCCDICKCIITTSSNGSINVDKTECTTDLTIDAVTIQNLIDVQSSSCIDVIKETVNGKLIFTPVLKTICAGGNSTPPNAINGLNKLANDIKLGGFLIENTNITLNNNYLSLIAGNGSNTTFAPGESWAIQRTGGGVNDLYTYLYHIPNYFKVVGNTNPSLRSYHSKAYLKVDNVNSTTTIATDYPNTDDLATPEPSVSKPSEASYQTTQYNTNTKAVYNKINAPRTIITSGTLIVGKRYEITTLGGGANFIPSGALTNTIGLSFTANSTPPIWGAGALELLGKIEFTSPKASIVINKSSIDSIIESDYNDYGLVDAATPSYKEIQLYRKPNRANVSYITEAVCVLIANDYLTNNRYAKMGVSTPTTNDAGINAPNPTQYTCYTIWKNDPLDIINQGHMATISPIVSFSGVNNVNSSITKVGVNTTNPSTVLDIVGLTTQASFRIRNEYTPSTSLAAGNKGDISWDTNFLYICVANNSWKRIPLVAW